MFISVLPYKSNSLHIVDKILVFDTNNCSLEYASYTECEVNNLGVVGIDLTDYGEYSYHDLNNLTKYVPEELCEDISVKSKYRGYVLTFPKFPDVEIRTPQKPGYTSDGRVASFSVNEKFVLTKTTVRAVEPLYLFKFGKYTVLRLAIVNLTFSYYTVILDEHGEVVSRYDRNFSNVIGDKGIAQKIDLLCDY